jgi:hypothetical protein
MIFRIFFGFSFWNLALPNPRDDFLHTPPLETVVSCQLSGFS